MWRLFRNIFNQSDLISWLPSASIPNQKITDYFGVQSLSESAAKVEKLGGKILVPKMAVSKMGYFTLCIDTEGDIFGLWENDPQTK
jgi:uncharacterized protein